MILTLALGLALADPAANEEQRAETLAWRAKREADLKADPLPPAQNRLEVAIEAGELDPHPGR